MIVVTGNGPANPGARYDLASDRWAPISSAGAPTTTQQVVTLTTPPVPVVWTGKEVIMWGMLSPASGARYNALADTWTPLTTVGAPKARIGHTAIWTGDSMVVVGGLENGSTLTDTTLVYKLTRPLYLYGKR